MCWICYKFFIYIVYVEVCYCLIFFEYLVFVEKFIIVRRVYRKIFFILLFFCFSGLLWFCLLVVIKGIKRKYLGIFFGNFLYLEVVFGKFFFFYILVYVKGGKK